MPIRRHSVLYDMRAHRGKGWSLCLRGLKLRRMEAMKLDQPPRRVAFLIAGLDVRTVLYRRYISRFSGDCCGIRSQQRHDAKDHQRLSWRICADEFISRTSP